MKPLWDHMTGQTNQALTAEDRMDSDFVIHLLWCIHLFTNSLSNTDINISVLTTKVSHMNPFSWSSIKYVITACLISAGLHRRSHNLV